MPDHNSTGRISVGRLHQGQLRAYEALLPYRFKALRCGRRFGKTELAMSWIAQGLLQGQQCAWFAPQHMMWSEVFMELNRRLAPLVHAAPKGVLRLRTGGRLDFWSLENPIAGRSRGYHRVVIDEAAFAKDGDVKTDGSMMDMWERAIKPTLFDHAGEALVCSNSAGKNPDNYFFNICNDTKFKFHEFHATTADNPLLPKQRRNETPEAWLKRREEYLAELKEGNDPRVFAQEYMAEFVDWAGAAFFNREKLLYQGKPVPYPATCDAVFAVIDTASKTGTDNDGTAVSFFAFDKHAGSMPLRILDWDIVQIEGATLEVWLPQVLARAEQLAGECRARSGSLGAFIEDQNSGTILLQQALNKRLRVMPIKSKLTAMGKDERAMSVSTYVHRGLVKYTALAFEKTVIYKGNSRNHLLDQVEGFRMGDKKSDREDDLLDTFAYGIALSLGNSEGF